MKEIFLLNRTFVLGVLLIIFSCYLIYRVDSNQAEPLTLGMALISGYGVMMLGWLIRTKQAKFREDAIIAMLLGEFVFWLSYYSTMDLRGCGLAMGIFIFLGGFAWIVIDYAVENLDQVEGKTLQE